MNIDENRAYCIIEKVSCKPWQKPKAATPYEHQGLVITCFINFLENQSPLAPQLLLHWALEGGGLGISWSYGSNASPSVYAGMFLHQKNDLITCLCIYIYVCISLSLSLLPKHVFPQHFGLQPSSYIYINL